MIHYRIEVHDAHSHRFVVSLNLPRPLPQQRLSLPVWIPGSYMVREFARHLSPITATQSGRPLPVRPIDKCTWTLDNTNEDPITLTYEVYAFDTSVRAAFLDAQRGFFNGTSVFLQAHGHEASPHAVTISGLPKGWQVGTSLPPVRVNKQGQGEYRAPDYDALVDHPVELGPFWREGFTVKGVRHELVVSGAPADFDGSKLLADTQRLCEAQLGFWHGRRKAPFDHYVFLLNAVDDGYGGLEHRQSTALICSRKDLPRRGRPVPAEAYTTLLGLISHEYFHTWNVKRLQPAEFALYDYRQENHTRMLWFFEGFTSYYDDQFLLRTGLIDAATYLKLLGKTINQVLATPGRTHYSVAQASFDAWTRYYRPDENTANATVSYYTKGSLVALCLDLTLRQLPPRGDREPTLDGVMRRLWALSRPITSADVAQALTDEAGAPPPMALTGRLPKTKNASEHAVLQAWTHLLTRWTEGCDDLPLDQLLPAMGVSWTRKTAPWPQRLGVRLSEAGGTVKVQAVMRHSPAETAGLSAGDELLALDTWRIRRTDDLSTWADEGRSQPLLVSRDSRILTLTLARGTTSSPRPGTRRKTTPGFEAQLIALGLHDTQAAQAQGLGVLATRKAWLGQ